MPIQPDEVSVYLADLDTPRDVSALNEAERARARRFHRARDAQHFARARATLRLILAEHTGLEPRAIELRQDEFGKPALAHNPWNVSFNLSHSGGLALYAVTRARRIGIDLECKRPLDDLRAVAARFFAQVEREQIAQLADGEAIDAFYRCWTRKEAFIKAIGTGLSTALADFAVSVEAEEAALRWHAREPSAPARWQLRDIDVPEGYAAALAVEGHVARVVRVS